MGISLRWQEEPFACEFNGAPGKGTLTMFDDHRLVWREPVNSAVAAHDRARELRDLLLAPRAKRA
jgi:hypothetical protein